MTRSRKGEAIRSRGRSPSARKKLRKFIRSAEKDGSPAVSHDIPDEVFGDPTVARGSMKMGEAARRQT